MNYIVFDLEFNQPFPFKTGKQTTLNPECPFEIIQIGAVKLDNNFNITGEFNSMIKPKIYPRMHPFVEKITGISLEDVKNAPLFSEAIKSFLEFIGYEENILCTWGSDDIKSLFKNILYYNLDFSLLSDQFLNIQMFASKYLNYENGKAIGLKNATTELNMLIDLPFHNAFNDAYYTAKVFSIVRPEKISPSTFQILDLTKKKSALPRIHISALTEHFEKYLGHPLSQNEKSMIKAAYQLGRKQAYDIPPKKKELQINTYEE